MLTRDMFLDSIELREGLLTIRVNDLIMVFNNLIEKADIILPSNHEEDPIRLLLDALGKKRIEIKKGERQIISDEVLELRINLEIKARSLLRHQHFVLCRTCSTPVDENQISQDLFKEA